MRRLTVGVMTALALSGVVACEGPADPVPGEPVELSYSPCLGATDVPSWFAYQDGDGPWTRVLRTGNSFDFTLTFGRGGVAFYTEDDEVLFILYASTEEMAANFPSCTGTVRDVSGTTTSFGALDAVRLTMGASDNVIRGSSATAPASFFLTAVDSDVDDLMAVRSRATDPLFPETGVPSSIVIRRGVDGTSTPTVDFGASEASVPVQHSLIITNVLASEEVVVESHLAMASTVASIAKYGPTITQATGPVITPFYAAPADRLVAGESHFLFANTVRSTSLTTEEGRFATSVFTEPADKSVTLGPPLGAVSVSGSARPAASYTIQPDYDNLWLVEFEQDARNIQVLKTRGYLGAETAVNLSVPDLSGVSGFQSAWLLAPGAPAQCLFSATNADLSWIRSRPTVFQGADRKTSFVP